MALLSKKDRLLITDPLSDNNPITVQVLGICSALAITAELEASVVMSVSVLFVMGVGNVVISMIRNIVPSKIRIIVQLTVIATLVIIVDLVLKAFLKINYVPPQNLDLFLAHTLFFLLNPEHLRMRILLLPAYNFLNQI